MWEKIQQVWKIKDIRKNVLIVLGLLVIYRLVAHIPVPGVNVQGLRDFLSGQQVFQLLDVFSGGTVKNFSLIMLGVAPYITSSIIFQLLAMIVPKLEEMQKEGESGQAKINMYTRWLTVPLAFLQSFAMVKFLANSSRDILPTNLSGLDMFTIIVSITAGTMFLVWIGELISERKVGNGISLLIFSGIVASLPSAIGRAVVNYTSADFYTFLMFGLIAIATVVGVVFINEGQRQIPVNYAKQVRGSRVFGGGSTHLPLRVNMAGVIPIIFAISLVVIPPMVAQFFVSAKAEWLKDGAAFIIRLFNNQAFYGISYFLLVFGFTFFYTSVIFHPQKIAENLQKNGGFVPGIRPGKETESYLAAIVSRINLIGASFLGLIAVLPLLLRSVSGSQVLTIGGTSLLIVVSVAIETAKQLESQLTMHEYDHI
ncbi:MAG: preprotein translocase subunit SecY [Candidatus Magasanikbacteria bacterium]|nr:preprotein translocase subunit SecY [Candidatus Magasanikbacteria bacterium]